jgi:hypothetical protein
MDNSAILDQTRRELTADILARLDAGGIDAELAPGIAGDVGELLDAVLVAFEGIGLRGRDFSVSGGVLFGEIWPVLVRHALPLSARVHGAERAKAERLALTHPGGLQPSD